MSCSYVSIYYRVCITSGQNLFFPLLQMFKLLLQNFDISICFFFFLEKLEVKQEEFLFSIFYKFT